MIKIIILLIFPIGIFAQTSLDSLIKSKTKITLEILKTNLKKATEQDYIGFDELDNSESNAENTISFLKIKSAMLLDVIEYFELNEIYNTELKKESFKESQEYKDKYKDLIKIKADLKNSLLYLDLSHEEIRDYDLKNRGFYISSNWKSHYAITPLFSTAKNGIGDIFIFIQVDKENALKIENNKEKIKTLLIFKPDIHIEKYKNYNIYTISTSFARFLIINSETNEIYFDKNYSVNKNNKKK